MTSNDKYPVLKVAREMVVKEDTTIKAFCERYIKQTKKAAENDPYITRYVQEVIIGENSTKRNERE